MRKKSKKQIEKEKHDARVKKIVIERDGEYCVVCGTPYDLELCHIVPKRGHPEYRWILENVFLCCKLHHTKQHRDLGFQESIWIENGFYDREDIVKSGKGTYIE